MKKEIASDTDREVAGLIEQARAQGVDENLLKRVGSAAGSREDHLADLRVLARPKGARITPKLPDLPPRVHERQLDHHEESIFEETLAGEHEPQRTV